MQVKLPMLIFFSFVLTTVLVIFIVEHNMTTVITGSQNLEYGEKIDVIMRAIENKYERLQKTGMVEIYEEDFQLSTLRQLRRSYPQLARSGAMVFIINTDGDLLLPSEVEALPVLPEPLARQLRTAESGSVDLLQPDGQRIWCHFKTFSPWNWKVGYLVPDVVRNEIIYQLTHTLVVVCGTITLIVVCVLLWLIRRQLQPINQLTAVSAEMARGNLATRIHVDQHDEIGDLANHFNLMQSAMVYTIESLKSSEKNIHTILSSIGDAVIATDEKRLIVHFNPVAEELTGWSKEDAIGRPLESVLLLVDPETHQSMQHKIVEISSTPHNLETDVLVIARDKRERLVADSVAPIRYEDGRVAGAVWVFRDVTEERELQEQLFQDRKMETIGQLAGGVAHDFNNMIGGVLGAAELLKMQPDGEQSGKYIDMIINAGERAAGLTAKLLAFARKKTISSTPVDADLSLRSALELLERTIDPRIRIKRNLQTVGSRVVGDFTQLENVFLNLLLNAAQAMPNGGDLSVTTKLTELDSQYCHESPFAIEPGTYLEVEVRDTGCGIPAENMHHIFEPFFTTKGQGSGTGLGLAEVLGTVQSHQGEVSVVSESDSGAVFKVLLPISHAEVVAKTPALAPLSGTGKILVVDDEGVMRVTAAAILAELGYQVLTADNGSSAVELFRDHHDDIDLVLLDMVMPEMNGRDCFFQMQKIAPEVRIVLSSGFTHSEELADLRAHQLIGFIRKPYRAAVLSRVVAAALAGDLDAEVLWDS